MSKRPAQSNFVQLATADSHSYYIRHIHDGTNTIVQICHVRTDGREVIYGTGLSRRRKGEKRNQDLGDHLAFARAFQEAAVSFARSSAELAGELPPPLHVEMAHTQVRVLTQERKKKASALKDLKRRDARRQFEKSNGGPWTPEESA